MSTQSISALVVAHDEEHQIAACLEGLAFADEIVVVLDRCADGTGRIAARYRRLRRSGNGPQVRHNLRRLGVRIVPRRHGGSRNTAADDAHQIGVRRSATKLAVAEVHARHRVTVWSMTVGARVHEQTLPVFDVGWRQETLPGSHGRDERHHRGRSDDQPTSYS